MLQANEVNSNVTLLLRGRSRLQPACWNRSRASIAADTTRHSVDPGLLVSVYQRLCRWFAATRRHLHRDFRQTSHCVSSDQRLQTALTCGQVQESPSGSAPCESQVTSASSDDSGIDTSPCSSLASASPASTTGGDPCRPCSGNQRTCSARADDDACADATNIRTDASSARTHLTTTLSCPNRKISSQSMAASRDRETMCATWPPNGSSTSMYGKGCYVTLAWVIFLDVLPDDILFSQADTETILLHQNNRLGTINYLNKLSRGGNDKRIEKYAIHLG